MASKKNKKSKAEEVTQETNSTIRQNGKWVPKNSK